MTPEEWAAQAAAFLASLPRRAAALDGVEASCPFDPVSIANSFIAKIQAHTSIGQICHSYADAMIAVDPGANKAWRKINEAVKAVS